MIEHQQTSIIACAPVIEKLLPLSPSLIPNEVLDFGLNLNPEHLKNTLLTAIGKPD